MTHEAAIHISYIEEAKATLSKELTTTKAAHAEALLAKNSTHEQALLTAKQEADALFEEHPATKTALDKALLAAQEKEIAFQDQISTFQK